MYVVVSLITHLIVITEYRSVLYCITSHYYNEVESRAKVIKVALYSGSIRTKSLIGANFIKIGKLNDN